MDSLETLRACEFSIIGIRLVLGQSALTHFGGWNRILINNKKYYNIILMGGYLIEISQMQENPWTCLGIPGNHVRGFLVYVVDELSYKT